MSEKLILKAARNEPVPRTPIWMMRQAGRYLPEYHETKKAAGGFWGLCQIPRFGVEVALQPVRRFDLDAAILFSDILIPAAAMGLDLAFDPGPVFAAPVRTDADVARLKVPDPEQAMPFVFEMLGLLRQALLPEKTLIGFSGAPFTVASYMIEGRSSPSAESTRRMLYQRPDLAHRLLEQLTQTHIRYLGAQIAAGAELIMLFDSMAFVLSPALYLEFALPYARQIVEALSSANAPMVYFAPGAMSLLDAMCDIGAHVLGIDWRISLAAARKRLGPKIAVQGNLDPAALLGSPASIRTLTRKVLEENQNQPGLIFNLGHGVLPSTPPHHVEAMIAALRFEG